MTVVRSVFRSIANAAMLLTVFSTAVGVAQAAPTAPSGLTATAASSTSITLQWTDNSSNETSFRVERSRTGYWFTTVATVGANATSFTNTGLTPSTRYYYRVRAIDKTGRSGYTSANAVTLANNPPPPPPPPTEPVVPSISSFGASPSTVTEGSSVTLSWSVSGATTVSIAPGISNVTGSSVTVTPSTTTTYTLTAANSAGSVTRTTTVTVNPRAAAPVINAFSASPASIPAGGMSTLNWSVSGADSISISPGSSVSGTSLMIHPTTTTTYTLSARNAAGTTTRTVTVTVTTQAAGDYPKGDPGSSQVLIRNTGEIANDNDIGAFRTVCQYSHMAKDDPIVYPGEFGRSHLHSFFGNTGANANSTYESLRNSGNSTCRGGIANRSSYWVPSLMYNGVPLKPYNADFYYKAGYNVPSTSIQVFPDGLRMIAGNGMASEPQLHNVYWGCHNNWMGKNPQIVDCPVGDYIEMSIEFPQCWNGRDVDSPDHKSHMAYPNGSRCPSTHPVALPAIEFHIMWKRTADLDVSKLRLSSDMYSENLPGGYSLHADWFEAWDPKVKETFVKRCLNAVVDCHSHLLGDGTMIYYPNESEL